MQKKALFVGLLSLAMALPLASCGGTSNAASTDAYSGPTYDTESIRIHYHRKDGVYTGWALWLWDKALNNGTEYAFNGSDSYGACASYALSTFGANVVNDSMGFIVKSAGSWSAKDPDGDRFINFSLYKKDANNVYHVYLESGDKGIYADANHSVADAITDAHFSFMNKIYVSTTNVMKHLALYEDDVALFNGDVGKNFYLYTFDTGKQADFEKHYYAEATFESGAVVKTVVAITSLYKTADFDNKYTYDGDLGALYTSSETQFKVWSPISSSIKLRVYGNGTPKSLSATLGNDTYEEYAMTKGDKGVWSYTVSGDLAGKYYTYFVTNSTYPSGKEIVDPYAKSAGVNGVRGMIVDFSATNPDGWDNFTVAHPYDRKAEVVYETAIPDLTGSSTWGGTSSKQGKFTGFYETGTKTTSTDNSGASVQISTGFDHVKDLGVNAVQIMPMFDSDNNETGSDYNWGYNPLNYNVVEGRYSSNPYDGLVRIKELKSLVKAYYDAGINIIMDVVYNHTSSLTGTNFDVLMPGYYYRYVGTTPSNGSGCGNETASEMPMFRKFMIDSTTFWTKEYKLGGFRFDLMGLHDIPTMNKIAAACKAINPKVTIYGEPWAGGTSALNTETPATQANGNSYEGYGQFNDGMRDALIKGGLNAASTTGWISNTASAISESDKASITKGIKGTTQSGSNNIPDPDKTTNYVTCHDNYTLYDRFYYGNKITDEAVVKKMNLLAQSVVMTSDGTSFMLSGEEMLRTKKGSSNSYNLDITYNALNYAKVAKNQDLLESYKKLINFKKTVTGVQADKASVALAATWNSASNMFYYDVVDAASGRAYRVVHANGLGTPGTVDLSGYSLYLDTLSRTDLTLSASTRVDNYETIIAYK